MDYSKNNQSGGNRGDQLLHELESLLKQLEKKRFGLQLKMSRVLSGKKRRTTTLRNLC